MAEIEIPKTHKAAIYDKPGSISTKVVTLDTPEPGAGQILVNLTHSGVCHSDLGIMTNSWTGLPVPPEEGQVGGHEGVGKVVKLGPGAEGQGVKVGDRVGIKWMSAVCGNCDRCLGGYDAACIAGKISGYFTPGTFQQYVLAPANYVTPIPDGLSSQDAAPQLCAGVTAYSALRKSGAKSGDWVVILGAGGGLGHIGVQLAARGFGLRVIGIDVDAKEQLVLDSGAEHFVGIGSPDMPTPTPLEVLGLTGGVGAQAVVVLTAANEAYASSVPMLKVGGRVVCVGIPDGEYTAIPSAFPQVLVAKEQSIVGVAVGGRRDAIEALSFAARGIVKVHSKVEKLEKLTEVFQDMHDGKLHGRVVIDLSS